MPAKRDEILFYREADLPPGVYTMETIVMDVVARQGSARVATLNVSAPQPSTFDMSSLVFVSRTLAAGTYELRIRARQHTRDLANRIFHAPGLRGIMRDDLAWSEWSS